MIVTKTKAGNALTVALEGRMDAISAPKLEEELKAELDGVTELAFDLEKLVYTSSAGLRVLLSMQKTMNSKGSMVIRNVRPEIMEIFDMVGFTDLLNIEE